MNLHPLNDPALNQDFERIAKKFIEIMNEFYEETHATMYKKSFVCYLLVTLASYLSKLKEEELQ